MPLLHGIYPHRHLGQFRVLQLSAEPSESHARDDREMGSERGRLHAWERKYNPGVTNASLVNIGTSVSFIRRQTVTGAFPRSRPRVAKEPTPLPYLKPVTSCQSAGRRQKTVTSVRYHQRPKLSVARRESEKQLPAEPELAYLVVDLQSGTLSQTSGESGLLCVHCTYARTLLAECVLRNG